MIRASPTLSEKIYSEKIYLIFLSLPYPYISSDKRCSQAISESTTRLKAGLGRMAAEIRASSGK